MMSLMKRGLALFLVMALLMSFSVTSYAAEDKAVVTLSCENDTATAGVLTLFQMSITNNPGVAGFTLEYYVEDASGNNVTSLFTHAEDYWVFNGEKLTTTSRPFVIGTLIQPSETIAWSHSAPVEGDGVFIEFELTPDESLVSGTYSIVLTLFEDDEGNFSSGEVGNSQPIPVDLQAYTFSLNSETAEQDVTPTITTNPEGATYTYPDTDEDVAPLTVEASVAYPADAELTYQWYKEAGTIDEKLDGATDDSYTPSLPAIGSSESYYCVVTNTYNDNDYTATSAAATIRYEKGNQETLSFSGSTSTTYGTPLALSTTGGSGDGEVTYEIIDGDAAELDDDQLVPTGVGDVTVKATKAADDNYNAATAEQTLTISKAELVFAGQSSYDVTVYTMRNPVTLTIPTVETVDGDEVTPTWSWTGNITVDEDNAIVAATEAAVEGNNATITLTYSADYHNDVTVTYNITVADKNDVSDAMTFEENANVDDDAYIYSGSEKSLETFVNAATISDGYTGSITYVVKDGSGETVASGATLSALTVTDAGTYTITAIYSDDENEGKQALTFTISQAEVAEPAAVEEEPVYTGSEQTGVVVPDGELNTLYTLEGDIAATDADDYTATFTLTDSKNYKWANNADGVVAWSIARAKIALPQAATDLTYTGDPLTGVPAATDGSYTITGNVETDADSYEAQVTPSKNHMWQDGSTGTVTVPWSIAQQTITINAAWDYEVANPFTYDGEAKTVAVTGVDTDAVEITYTNASATNAGKYKASATFAAKNDNYVVSGTIADLEWEILKATVTVPTAVTGLEYNGETQTGVVLPENAVYTLTGNTGVNAADTYSATATLRDPANYKWNDGGEETTTRSIGWSIAKADAVALTSGKGLRFDNTSAQTVTAADILALLNDDNDATTVTIASVATGTNSILAANASVVEGAVSYALTSGLSEENDGDTAVLTVTFSSNNYEDSTVAFTVSVMEKVDVDDKIAFVNGSAVYTGAAQEYKTASMTDASLTGTITYEAPVMKDVDNYTVKAIYEDADNYGEKEVYFTITAAELTITDATVAPKTYDGNTTADVTEVSFDGLLGEDVMSDAGYTVTAANFNDADVKDANAVTFTVELDSSDAVARNYKLKSATATVDATITPATITPTVEVIADQSFTGSALTPAVTVLNGSAVMDEADYSVSYDQTTNINVGTSTVTVSDVAGSNYTFSDVTADFDIIAAAAPETISGVSAGYRYSLASQKSVKITGIPANAGTVTAAIGTVENGDSVLTGTPTASFDGTDVVVSFVLTGFDAYTENLSATIPVTVSMTNYESKTVDVVITITDKEPVVLAANNIIRDYTGKALSASAITGTATCEGATVAGTWSFVDYDATTMVNAGSHTVKVKFTPNDPETYDEAEITITITIKKIAPTGEPSVTPIRRENMTLADAELNVGMLNPAEGSLFWYDDEDTIVMENKAYRWGFIPDNENYTPLNGEIIPYVVQYIEPGEGGGDRPGAGSSTTEDDKTGAVTETIVTADGVVGTTVTERDGTVSSIEVEIPEAAADKAAERGEAIVLPIEVTSTSNEKSAQEIEITAPYGETKIEIPVTNASNSTVAVIVGMYGREDVVAAAAVRKDGIVLTIHGNVTLKIVDRKMMFNDVHYVAHWSEAAVDFVTARGIMNGMTETEFAPDLQLTRGMLWTILARLDGVDTAGGAEWYSKGMDWARNNGISDGLYPNNNITREEAITMLWRYAKQPTMSRDYLAGYADGSLTSDWAEDAMNWAISIGLIKGDENGLLNPNGTATRAEITTMLMRFIQNIL